MTYYWNVSGSKLYNTYPCGKMRSKDNVEWKFLLLGGVCSITTFHVGLTFEAWLAFEVLNTQYYVTKFQSALNLQVANEYVILRRNALDAFNDAIFSYESDFNFFSNIQ